MEYKVCSKCKVEKLKHEFYPRKDRGINSVRSKCKLCCSNDVKENRDRYREYTKKSYQKNKEKYKLQARIYRKNNPDLVKEIERKSREKHKSKRLEFSINYTRNRRKNDSIFKLRHSLSNNIYQSFKNRSFIKTEKTNEILGCSIEFFTEYIQSKFEKGMSLENYGEWHLDHIIPLSTAKSKEDVYSLCHYTNYQPLWAKDNLKKSNKIIIKQLQIL